MKRIIVAILAVFVCWTALDFVIHGLILGSTYAATPQLWRPLAEMKMGLMHFTVLVMVAAFVWGTGPILSCRYHTQLPLSGLPALWPSSPLAALSPG